MTFRKTIQILSSKIEECDSLMNVDELDYEKNDIPRFSTIERWTADYGNQYEIDLKVCSGSNGDPLRKQRRSRPPWRSSRATTSSFKTCGIWQ